MKKLFALGVCLVTLSALNAYSLTATPLPPVDFINDIPNERPILLPQDPKHFLIYTRGEITLVDAIARRVAGILPKPNLYENLRTLFTLQNGKLLALDVTGLYISQNLGKHWDKISENIFENQYYATRFLQNKAYPQNLFAVTHEKIFLSHDEGRTWKILWDEALFSINCHPFDILQTEAGNIYIITHHGKIQMTHDEGRSWQDLSKTPIPPEPENWIEKAFCSLGQGDKGYVKIGQQIFEIKSPQEVRLVYNGKGRNNDCFVDNQQNLYVTSMEDNETKTNIFLLDQDFKETLVNSLQGRIYSITQDIEDKTYLDTSLGLAAAQTLKSVIIPYPAIFKQGRIHELSIKNETDFTATVGYDNLGDPFDTYLSRDGGSHYTHLPKKYYKLFYFKEALNYLVRCNSQLCLNTSQDNGKTWALTELPKEIKILFEINIDRGVLILKASQGFFLSSDLENWNAILTTDIYDSKKSTAVLQNNKPLYIPILKEKQIAVPKKVKSIKTVNAPNMECFFYTLEMNISPSKTFTLLQHGCRPDDDIYLSKDEGVHWKRAYSNLPSSVLDSPFSVPNVFLENGDLVLVDYNGASLQKSTDGGVHFKNLLKNLPPVYLAGANVFAHSGNSLFAFGSSRGNKVYFSRDAGDTWDHLNIINSEIAGLQFANNKLFIATESDGIFSVIF